MIELAFSTRTTELFDAGTAAGVKRLPCSSFCVARSNLRTSRLPRPHHTNNLHPPRAFSTTASPPPHPPVPHRHRLVASTSMRLALQTRKNSESFCVFPSFPFFCVSLGRSRSPVKTSFRPRHLAPFAFRLCQSGRTGSETE